MCPCFFFCFCCIQPSLPISYKIVWNKEISYINQSGQVVNMCKIRNIVEIMQSVPCLDSGMGTKTLENICVPYFSINYYIFYAFAKKIKSYNNYLVGNSSGHQWYMCYIKQVLFVKENYLYMIYMLSGSIQMNKLWLANKITVGTPPEVLSVNIGGSLSKTVDIWHSTTQRALVILGILLNAKK